ncbi:MAG TPA: hypothetical protein VKA38_01730 [Draconibacterium sp.]|nr:hypothetical protein [Draconibacterium sp.]
MKNYFQTHPFWKIGVLIIPLVLFIFLMGRFFPKEAPEGFSSYIVAFEFAKTPADLQQLLGNLPKKAIHKIDVGNLLDFGFMATYTALLILSFLRFSKEFSKKWLKLGVVLAIIILLGDFTENIFLLRLTDNFLTSAPEETIVSNLSRLHIFTWIKWGTLAVAFFLLYTIFYRKKWYIEIVGVTVIFPLLFLIATPKHTPQILTVFTNSIFLCFAVLMVYLFVYQKKVHKKS